jgi:hypothetical protein
MLEAFQEDEEECWEGASVSPRTVIVPASRGNVRTSSNWKGKVPDPPKPLVEESFSFYEDRSPHKPERKYSVSPPRYRLPTDGRGEHAVRGVDRAAMMTPSSNGIVWQGQHLPPSIPFEEGYRDRDRSNYSPHGIEVDRQTAGIHQPQRRHDSSPASPSSRHGDRSYDHGAEHPRGRRGLMLIQVAPGIQAPLRGSDETWEAIKQDFYVPGMCLSCDITLFVIQDAAYVLCPDCHCVNIMEGDFVDRIAAGVGLGFKYDDLMRWQLEILQEQKRSRKSASHGRHRH